MSIFRLDPDLEIGTVFEVTGGALKISLSRDIKELTRSHSGRVYDVGQIGSLLKIHLGRKIIFATVRLLRLETDEEATALASQVESSSLSLDRRVLEADLLGEGWLRSNDRRLKFSRGVSNYPLPLQSVHLITKEETEELFRSAEEVKAEDANKHLVIGSYVGATRVDCRANIDKLFGQHCAVLGSTGSGKSSAVAAIVHSVLQHTTKEGEKSRPNIILIDRGL